MFLVPHIFLLLFVCNNHNTQTYSLYIAKNVYFIFSEKKLVILPKKNDISIYYYYSSLFSTYIFIYKSLNVPNNQNFITSNLFVVEFTF